MTLNKVIEIFKVFAEAHQQIATFFYGDPADLLAQQDIQYPAMCLYLNDGIEISRQKKQTTYPFKVVLMDLVNIVQNAEGNFQDVESDLMQIGEDIIAMVNYKGKQDPSFMPSQNNAARFTDPKNDDLALALIIDCSISTMYNANRCQVPATDYEFTDTLNPELVFTYRKQITSESSTFVIPELSYRYIVAVVLGTANLTPKTGEGDPDIMEYKYDVATGTFTTGMEAQVGQILQIIHRAI
jgi:hypothetical protein